jgi:TatD DNase family protein
MPDAIDKTGLELVDAHCHIDLFPDAKPIVEETEHRKIHTIAVTNAPSVFFHTRDLCRGRNYVHAAVGLHPELAVLHGHELDQMWGHLDETRFVGEVGLDYTTTDAGVRQQQRDVFSAILMRCAERGGKIITVHSRRSATDALATIGRGFPGTIIMHWFSGTTRELEHAAMAGCWFSVNPAMVSSRSGQTLISAMPRDRLITETDGPFLKNGGRGAQPKDVITAIRGLSSLWRSSEQETANIVIENFRNLTAAPDQPQGI